MHLHGTEELESEEENEDIPTYNTAERIGSEIKTTKQIGNVEVGELYIELRRKYINILKSLYWEHFEEGQCQSNSVTILIESADRALDHDENPIEDWCFIE